ncbi:putative NAD dependent epimerase/dehydratase [Xylariomycetidae sp. FL0641]|nr:putative NAD dependent epimerase/dehydratase [Xylariomycetidae sp. FL0641]
MSPKIFVTSATGTLGNAVAHALIREGWEVNASTRDASSAAAQGLAAAGVKLFVGDWDDTSMLSAALAGCAGVFLNLAPSFHDLGADARQGRAMLALARAAGVRHVVYSSAVGASDPSRLPNCRPGSLVAVSLGNKRAVEEAVRGGGFAHYTILRPGGFMANWLAPKVGLFAPDLPRRGGAAAYTTALRPGGRIPSVDEADLAALAVAALRDPGRFGAREVAVVSEVQTMDEIVAQLAEAAGRPLEVRYLAEEEIEAKRGDPFFDGQVASREMFDLFIDMDEVRKLDDLPKHTFREYLQRNMDRVRATYGQ